MKWVLGRTRYNRVRQIVAEEYNVYMSYGDDSLMEDSDRLRGLLRVRFREEGYGAIWMTLLLQVAVALIKFWLEGGFEEAPRSPVEGEP